MKKYLLRISLFLISCSGTPYDGEPREVYCVRSNGAELPVIISGKDTKDIILYVHGGSGSTSLQQFYAPVFENFKKEYRVVLYDQRGSGGARGYITEDSMTVDQHVKDLDAVVNSVLTKYPQSSIYMIGHSSGGIIFAAPALNMEDNIPLTLASSTKHISYVSKAFYIYIPELAEFDTYNIELVSKLLPDPYLGNFDFTGTNQSFTS